MQFFPHRKVIVKEALIDSRCLLPPQSHISQHICSKCFYEAKDIQRWRNLKWWHISVQMVSYFLVFFDLLTAWEVGQSLLAANNRSLKLLRILPLSTCQSVSLLCGGPRSTWQNEKHSDSLIYPPLPDFPVRHNSVKAVVSFSVSERHI